MGSELASLDELGIALVSRLEETRGERAVGVSEGIATAPVVSVSESRVSACLLAPIIHPPRVLIALFSGDRLRASS